MSSPNGGPGLTDTEIDADEAVVEASALAAADEDLPEQAVQDADVEAAHGADEAADVATADDPEGEAAAAVDEPEEEVDPIEEMRAALRRAPGDWYVIHSYAGYENRVKANLETRITSLNMEDYIFEIQVPMEEVTEIKSGQRKLVRIESLERSSGRATLVGGAPDGDDGAEPLESGSRRRGRRGGRRRSRAGTSSGADDSQD